MYYYLSFLRPPPTAAAAAVTVTPQIANDLRTELKQDEPTEIYYTWQHAAPTDWQHAAVYTSPPTKLTTYRPPVNTYKPVSIPLPPQAKPGQCWRLGLFAPPARGVLGRLDSLAAHVCGVWSDGIVVLGGGGGGGGGPTGKQAAGKQTRVFREWQLGLGDATDGNRGSKRDVRGRPVDSPQTASGMLRIVEQTSFDLDKKIWDSGLALSAWLQDRLARTGQDGSSTADDGLIEAYVARLTTSPDDDGGASRRTVRVVELGAGTGLVSFALASVLRRLSSSRAAAGWPLSYDIYASDLESALPLIDENAALNAHLWTLPAQTDARSAPHDEPAQLGDGGPDAPAVALPNIEIHSKVLDWDEALPAWVHRNADGGPLLDVDLVIAADVTYNTASFPALVQTLRSLLRPAAAAAAAARAPLFLLAYKERDTSERDLWAMARQEGIWLDMVDVIPGHEQGAGAAGATEIWIGGMGERDRQGRVDR